MKNKTFMRESVWLRLLTWNMIASRICFGTKNTEDTFSNKIRPDENLSDLDGWNISGAWNFTALLFKQMSNCPSDPSQVHWEFFHPLWEIHQKLFLFIRIFREFLQYYILNIYSGWLKILYLIFVDNKEKLHEAALIQSSLWVREIILCMKRLKGILCTILYILYSILFTLKYQIK